MIPRWLRPILRGYRCAFGCGARYRHPADLRAHYRLDHAGDRP